MTGAVVAHVSVAGVTDEVADAVRQAVTTWHATRHDLEAPRVLYCVAPAEPMQPGEGWSRLIRWVSITLADPTPDDLLTLADVLWRYGPPELSLTREPPALVA